MVVTIHQPDFLPWLGFFDRLYKCDLYIVLDDVQFLRRGWHHRDKIKTPHGVKWLTVPVLKKGKYNQNINEVEIDNNKNWKKNFLGLIANSYNKSANFSVVYNCIEKILAKNHTQLIELNMDLLHYCIDVLDIHKKIIFSSSLKINLKATDKLVNLVKAVNGKAYLTGSGSRSYLDEETFKKEKIELLWQNFKHPYYSQLHGSFEKMLSVIDFLMMVNSPKEFF
ncbi:WbqC-like protein family [Candidatus Magnetomorum sp. HK-1]|nr:WbqC-like protein family [Candidatus Magnetomorum sp. HK-1]